MAKMYYDADADLGLLKGKTIAILGYGSQGHAHSLNLKESGLNVIVAENFPKAKAEAEANGLKVVSAAEASAQADVIMMLLPDAIQREVYYKDVEKNLSKGKMLMFAHGFNIHYSQIVPPADVDVAMVAPKAPGHRAREVFKEGKGVPALVAVYQNATGKAKEMALAYAKGIGSTRAGVLETTFAEETETDLFGEQCVLCGGATALVKAGFETLVEAGYQPEIAYFECLHELKLIVDLMYEGGMARMRYSISDTAEWGDYIMGPRLINAGVKDEMKKALGEIQNGTFATQWILENQAGRPSFNAYRRIEANHLIETVGAKLREMMPWLKKK